RRIGVTQVLKCGWLVHMNRAGLERPTFPKRRSGSEGRQNKATPTRKMRWDKCTRMEKVSPRTTSWPPSGTGKLPNTSRIWAAQDKGETIWECSIWMVKEFPRTTFKLICGSGWLILNQTQTCLLPKLT